MYCARRSACRLVETAGRLAAHQRVTAAALSPSVCSREPCKSALLDASQSTLFVIHLFAAFCCENLPLRNAYLDELETLSKKHPAKVCGQAVGSLPTSKIKAAEFRQLIFHYC